MPLANKAKNMFDNGKTSSYDIKSIVNCQQSNKNSSTFKLVVLRDAEHNKRYEFEAENPKIASKCLSVPSTAASVKHLRRRNRDNNPKPKESTGSVWYDKAVEEKSSGHLRGSVLLCCLSCVRLLYSQFLILLLIP